MHRSILEQLIMSYRCITCHVVVILILALAPAIASSATPRSPTTPAKRISVSTQLQALYRKEQKLQQILTRAQDSQRQLKANLTQTNYQSTQASLRRWHDMERRAQALIKKLNKTIAAMKKRAVAASRKQTLTPTPPSPMARDIALTRLDGKRERIDKHRGAVVLLHFWATWCRPCVKEMPVLQRMRSRFHRQNFSILAVSLDARKKDVRRFLRRKGLKLPVYLDPGHSLYKQIIGGSAILPRSLLIDQSGRIVRSYVGARHLASPGTFSDIRHLLAN